MPQQLKDPNVLMVAGILAYVGLGIIAFLWIAEHLR